MEPRILNQYIIATYKVLFFILGTIGNLLFIHLNIRRKQIRCRTSILQSFQCFCHLFCQLGTIMNGIHDVGVLYKRENCFYRIWFYIFFQAAQGMTMTVIMTDIFVLVKFPIFYRNVSISKYIIFTSIPILLFSTFTTLYAYSNTNQESIYSCSPPFVFGVISSIVYKWIFVFLSDIVLVLFIILRISFWWKSHDCQYHNNHARPLKTMKRLQITVVVFIVTWHFSQVLGLFVLQASKFSMWKSILLSHNVLFVCLSYSNTFYVTMWRSKEYRDQFYMVWWPKKSSVAVIRSLSKNSSALNLNLAHQRSL